MIERLLEFIALLRTNGLRVSTAETLDAVRAAEVVGFGEPATLSAALAATLVKRAEDQAVFGELFDLYFRRSGDFAKGAVESGSPLFEDLRARGFTDEELEALLALLADEAARLSQTARLGLGVRRGHVELLVRRASQPLDFDRMVNPLQVGFFSQKVLQAMGLAQAERELALLAESLARKMGAARAASLAEALRDQLGKVRGAVRQFIADELARRQLDSRQKAHAELLAERPLSQLSEAEIARLRVEVDRLAKRLRETASRRKTRRRRGRLDVRRTLRASLATGGVPFSLRYVRRRVDKPRLVILCDISDSVRAVSRFMLQLAYSLQDRFEKVRSFVFVADLGETTDLFARHELSRAVEIAFRGSIVNVFANSNFGRAFRSFRERHLDAVTSKTTVVVIGDGRNNYQPPEAWALADIRARARRVLWLNPEPRLSWAFGDSAMRSYEPHCDRVEVVQDLESLRRVIDGLVL